MVTFDGSIDQRKSFSRLVKPCLDMFVSDCVKTSDSNEESRPRQSCDYLLNLSIDWNCINTAKEWIVQDLLSNIQVNSSGSIVGTSETRFRVNFQDKKSVFIRSLTKQRDRFVEYFLQLGLPVDQVFFDRKTNPFASRDFDRRGKRYQEFISTLYDEQSIVSRSTGRIREPLFSFIYNRKNRDDWILREVVTSTNDLGQKSIRTTDDLNDLFRDLIGGYIKPLYYDSQIEEQEDRLGVKRFTNIISAKIKDLEQGPLIGSDARYNELAIDYILRDLFLWSIVMNHMELSKVFLAHMKDRICGALVATEILSHLFDTCSDAVHGDKKIYIKRWIHYFEQYAIDCLDLCFKNNPDIARLLTIQRVELFGDVTCLQVKRFSSATFEHLSS